jgi:ribosome-associated translation inhibitor RaiA
MPDGIVQWFDARIGEGRIVRGSREYPLRAEDAEPAARHPGARVHFDIRREEGSERAVNATLRVGTRVSPRQRRFGDLAGARTPDAKGAAPFAHPHPDLVRQVEAPVLFARVKLSHRADPAIERPAVVEAALDVNGRLVRAHRAAHAFHEAVDLVEARLEDRLGHLAQHREERTQRPVEVEPGEWRHGALPAQRPDHFPRAAEDRQVVRRKAFTMGEATLEEAAFDLEVLDHDFYLFREPAGEGESLLVRRPDGRYGLLRTAAGPLPVPVDAVTLGATPVAVLEIDEAIERMNESGDPFVFFRRRDTGRGNVVYWRYDGHYGLIEPAG